MNIPSRATYLSEIIEILKTHWPQNRTVNIVCHGHSVPAGYFATPVVDTFNSYPHLLHAGLKSRFPFAVINVIVTAIGGENSESGAARFADEVLCHRPDLVTLDYGLNDRRIGLKKAKSAWSRMISAGQDAGIKMILLTPTSDGSQNREASPLEKADLIKHAAQIRRLAARDGVGLVDSFAAFQKYCRQEELSDLLSWINHPNRAGHDLVVKELMRWFPT